MRDRMEVTAVSAQRQTSERVWGLSDMSGRPESSGVGCVRSPSLRTMAQGPYAQGTKYGGEGGLCCNPSLSRFIKYLMGAVAREPTGGILG